MKQNCTGTTVVELVVVLLCGAVLLTIAVPGFDRLRDEWTLWGAAHLIRSSLQWGRMHAIASNGSLTFNIDPGGKGFSWADSETGERFEESVRIIPGAVRITSAPNKPLRFYPKGNAAPSGTYVVQGNAGRYRVVVAITGRIRLQRF